MAFEKEIKKAIKIADQWTERSVNDEDFLTSLKKQNVAWEKQAIIEIEALIKEKDFDSALTKIKRARETLIELEGAAEMRFKSHFSWSRSNDGPRRGVAGICKDIDVKEKTPAYEAVNKALAKVLLEQSKQFKRTEETWSEDLKPRIGMLFTRLDTLEKLLERHKDGKFSDVALYRRQFDKDCKAYFEMMTKAENELKVETAINTIKRMTEQAEAWLSGDLKAQTDQLQLMADRITYIDKLLVLAEKNYNRVLKNVPQEVKAKTFLWGTAFTDFEKANQAMIKKFREHQQVFKLGVAQGKRFFPKISV